MWETNIMKFSKSNISSLLIVSLSLGLAWAIRGSFGHEWGASWAGAMGTFALIVAVGKKEWFRNAPALAALGAIGWAVGGMCSYGVVIGYCRSTDFVNALYGFSMLFIIGLTYGMIGGGLLGLGLESDEKRKTNWASLITQMVAGGMLSWGFLIYQMEWFMTPPRSELWAAAFGASAALAWFLWRENYRKAFRVAVFSALGSGFGFAFGNFIQNLGAISGISYNWWNVMEFTIGFFGGLGMTYAVMSSEWSEKLNFTKNNNLLALLFIFIVIQFVNHTHLFTTEYFLKISHYQSSVDPELFASNQLMFGWIIILFFSILAIFIWNRYQKQEPKQDLIFAASLFFANSLYYAFFLIVRDGLLYDGFGLDNSKALNLPILFLISIIYYFKDKKEIILNKGNVISTIENWKIIMSALILVLILITLISINLHDGLPGSHLRFE